MAVPGFDYSEHQDNITSPTFPDFTKAKKQADFCIARVAYGLGPDRIFPRCYDDAVKTGLIVGVFPFVDYRTYARDNVAALKKYLAGRDPAFVGIDLEKNDKYWPGGWPAHGANLTAWVWDYINEYDLAGMTAPLLLYTNEATIIQMRAWPARLAEIAAQIPLWFPWWQDGDPPAFTFAPWTKVTIRQHQNTAVGKLYGMESDGLDTDTWMGTLDELKAFVARTPPPPTVEQRLTIIEQKQKDHGW